jgi:hypothetical protein
MLGFVRGERITMAEARNRITSTVEVVGGPQGVKRIAPNTFSFTRQEDGCTVVRLYDTDIATRCPDGTVILNSGGHQTPTTKDRVNEILAAWHLPWRVYQSRRVWHLVAPASGLPKQQFMDGMVLHPDGTVELPEGAEAVLTGQAETEKHIRKYLAVAQDALKQDWPAPGGGDCWLCLLVDGKTGKSWGDTSKNFSHLLSHLEEGYVPGALVLQAFRDAGFTDESFWIHRQMGNVDVAIRALGKYLRKRLLGRG